MEIIYAAISVLFVLVFIAFYFLNKQKSDANDDRNYVVEIVGKDVGSLRRETNFHDQRIANVNTDLEFLRKTFGKELKEGRADVAALQLELFILQNPLCSKMKFVTKENKEFTISAKYKTVILRFTPEDKTEVETAEFYAQKGASFMRIGLAKSIVDVEDIMHG